MKTKSYLYFIGVLVITLLAAWWVQTSRAVNVVSPEREKPMFLALTHDLEVGSFIEAGDLVWQVWPNQADESVLSRYFVRGIAKPEDLVGSVLRMTMKRGDFMSTASSVRIGDAAFLAAVLKPGARAMTIPIDRVSGSAGLIRPGNYVDIILSGRIQDGAGGNAHDGMAQTLLSDVRVIAIDRQVENLAVVTTEGKDKTDYFPRGSGSDQGTATLEVSPKQAELLALGRKVGDLSLSLRSLLPGGSNEKESDQATLARTAIAEMFPAKKLVERYAEDAAPPEVVQLLGTERRARSAGPPVGNSFPRSQF